MRASVVDARLEAIAGEPAVARTTQGVSPFAWGNEATLFALAMFPVSGHYQQIAAFGAGSATQNGSAGIIRGMATGSTGWEFRPADSISLVETDVPPGLHVLALRWDGTRASLLRNGVLRLDRAVTKLFNTHLDTASLGPDGQAMWAWPRALNDHQLTLVSHWLMRRHGITP